MEAGWLAGWLKSHTVFMLGGISLEKRNGARVSWSMRNEPSRGAVFFFLGSRHEEKTQRDSKEGFVVTSGCSSCRIENAIFLQLHWFKDELNFSFLAIQVYRVVAVCFCYSLGGRSMQRSYASFKAWRKN